MRLPNNVQIDYVYTHTHYIQHHFHTLIHLIGIYWEIAYVQANSRKNDRAIVTKS